MFSVNRMSNGRRPNISNKVQDKRVPVAFCIAIAIVIIVSSLLLAGLMLSYGRGSTAIKEDINECRSDPCLNEGYCTDMPNGYTCACVAGWTGLTCSTDINECSSDPCLNGGYCTDMLNGYTCACVAGWTGPNCSIVVIECPPVEDDRIQCGELHTDFSDIINDYPNSCDAIAGLEAPTPNTLEYFLTQTHTYPYGYMYSYPMSTMYNYPSNTPKLDGYSATHVLVNTCHGCLCLKLDVRICIDIYNVGFDLAGIPDFRCEPSAPPTGEFNEGEQVTIVVTKTGTDASNVVIQIDGQTMQPATAGVDYQVITPDPFTGTLNFDLGDQVMFVTIDIVDDDVEEGEETFEVQLSNPSSGTIEYPILTITIIDND